MRSKPDASHLAARRSSLRCSGRLCRMLPGNGLALEARVLVAARAFCLADISYSRKSLSLYIYNF